MRRPRLAAARVAGDQVVSARVLRADRLRFGDHVQIGTNTFRVRAIARSHSLRGDRPLRIKIWLDGRVDPLDVAPTDELHVICTEET